MPYLKIFFIGFILFFVTLPALAGIDIADCDRGV